MISPERIYSIDNDVELAEMARAELGPYAAAMVIDERALHPLRHLRRLVPDRVPDDGSLPADPAGNARKRRPRDRGRLRHYATTTQHRENPRTSLRPGGLLPDQRRPDRRHDQPLADRRVMISIVARRVGSAMISIAAMRSAENAKLKTIRGCFPDIQTAPAAPSMSAVRATRAPSGKPSGYGPDSANFRH